VKLELVLIPPGKFIMGSPETEEGRYKYEGPVHEVVISKPFYLGKFEVTQKQYSYLMKSNPSWFSPMGRGSKDLRGANPSLLPVDNITWNEAQRWLDALNTKLGKKLARFPNEAEWEYAARAGTRTPYHLGLGLDKTKANFNYGLGRTEEVGKYQQSSNAFGLFDIHGNVWEWCGDWHDDATYLNRAKHPDQCTDPEGAPTGKYRVLRGGGWNVYPRNARIADRFRMEPTQSNNSIGLRVAVNLPE
jgi:formylglycine-generating enzyme required for sulfatase activity